MAFFLILFCLYHRNLSFHPTAYFLHPPGQNQAKSTQQDDQSRNEHPQHSGNGCVKIIAQQQESDSEYDWYEWKPPAHFHTFIHHGATIMRFGNTIAAIWHFLRACACLPAGHLWPVFHSLCFVVFSFFCFHCFSPFYPCRRKPGIKGYTLLQLSCLDFRRMERFIRCFLSKPE